MIKPNIKYLIGVFSILISLNFVSAAITIVAPVNYTNHTGTATFNVSYINGTDATDAVNATFYYNLSGSWTLIGTGICENGATASSCNGSLDISSLTEGKYSINATLNGDLSLGASVLTHSVILDSVAPNVSSYYNTVNNGNYSGTIVLNASVSDGGIGVDSVYFNITYPNGTQLNFTKASNSGIYYNLTLVTSGFSDGNYNITAYANDTQLNNLNNSEMISVTFDNTAPTGSISCSPSSVNVGNTVTCTCSPTDATSGVNTSSYTASTTPSTSNTGAFTQTCTFSDLAGNTGTVSTSYIVELGGGGGDGGVTTPPFYTKTIPMVSKDFSELQTITQQLKKKERIKVKINENIHFVGVRELTLTSATIEIVSEPVQIILDVGEDAKVDVNDDNFYDIYVKLNAIKNGKADLTINYLHEALPEPEEGEEAEAVETTGEIVEPEEEGIPIWVWIVIIVIVIAIISGLVVWRKRSG